MPQLGQKFDVWVDGKELRAGQKATKPTGGKVSRTGLATELAENEWQLAMWGRGSMLSSLPPGIAQQIPIPGLARTLVGVASALNEVAIAARVDGNAVKFVAGVRTMWSNPDDVVAKITAVKPDDVLNGQGGAALKAIADGATNSPFAGDVKA